MNVITEIVDVTEEETRRVAEENEERGIPPLSTPEPAPELRERLIPGRLPVEMSIERRGWWGRRRARRLCSVCVMLPAWIVTIVAVRCLSPPDSAKNNTMLAMMLLFLVGLLCLGWSAEPPDAIIVDPRLFRRR
ncbi:uncharacterized protein LOC144713957 [Wolffia australiana]